MIFLRISFFFIFFLKDVFIFASYADRDHIEDVIKNLISEQLTYSVKNIKLRYESISHAKEFYIKNQNIQDVFVQDFDQDTRKIEIGFILENGESKSLGITYDGIVEIYLSNRYLKKGAKISDSDLLLGSVKISQMDNFITSRDQIVGMYIVRNILAKRAFRVSDLAMQYDVNQNDVVDILYKSDFIEIRAIGTALSSASIGDTLRVRNNDSGVVVIGRVITCNSILVGE